MFERTTEIFKRNLFEVIFIVSEHDVLSHKDSMIRTFRYVILYVLDAGQVFSSLVTREYKWNDSVVDFMNSLDIIKLVMSMVRIKYTGH